MSEDGELIGLVNNGPVIRLAADVSFPGSDESVDPAKARVRMPMGIGGAIALKLALNSTGLAEKFPTLLDKSWAPPSAR